MCSTFTCTSFFSPQFLTNVLSNQVSYAGTKCTHWRIVRSPLRWRFLNRIGPAKEKGAVAPPTPTAAAPTPALLSSSRLLKRVGMYVLLPRSAEGSAGEPCDEAVEERVVEQRKRNAGDENRSHDRRPVEEVALDEVRRHADGQRAVLVARDERDRVDELVEHE